MQVGREDSKAKDALAQVDRDKWLDTIPRVAQEVAHRGIAVTFPKVFLSPNGAFECAGLVENNYFIFPNGRVYRCPLCADYPLHSLEIIDDRLVHRPKVNEADLFPLTIPEGCVMNRIIQPANLPSGNNGKPTYKVACCMLKEEIVP